jgi:flagellar biogenesis protein FliO
MLTNHLSKNNTLSNENKESFSSGPLFNPGYIILLLLLFIIIIILVYKKFKNSHK